MTTTTETTTRVYHSRDYDRFADALRRARKDKTPGQLQKVDALTLVIAGTFGEDHPQFDAEAFTASARLRIESTEHARYAKWAGSRGYDTENPAAACEHYSEFYDHASYAAADAEDDEDELNLDDEEDQEDDAEE